METVRLRLTLQYDGTDFEGFQAQEAGRRTVQAELEAALAKLAGHPVRVHGAGRTDAGVHALGQVAHADVVWKVPLEHTVRALNANLPDDVAVTQAAVADAQFHARFRATGRVYRYAIWNRPARSALLGRYVWHRIDPLDVAAMQAAASRLVGTHDFAAFGKPAAPGKSTERRLTRCDIRAWRGCVLVTVEGNAFLRHMVRALVGTLAETGRGRLGPDDVERIRESGDPGQCPLVAPAQGLCLVRVAYDGRRLT